jgi:hypothetical protein
MHWRALLSFKIGPYWSQTIFAALTNLARMWLVHGLFDAATVVFIAVEQQDVYRNEVSHLYI